MKPKNPQRTSQSDYDADVIVVVDGNIDKDNVTGGNGDVLYFDRKEPKPKAISLRIFHDVQELRRLEARDLPSCFRKKQEEFLARDKQALEKSTNARIVDILLTGRLRVTSLINSRGGLASRAAFIDVFQSDIEQRGGVSRAFVTREAASAATKIFEIAQERHACQDAQFLWHISRLPPEYKSKVHPKDHAQERSEIAAFFETAVLPERREFIRNRIRTLLKRTEDHIRADALLLQKLGLLHTTYPSCSALFGKLKDEGVLTPEVIRGSPGTNLVARHMFRSLVMEEGLNSGDHINFSIGPTGKITTSVPRNPRFKSHADVAFSIFQPDIFEAAKKKFKLLTQ